MGMPPIIWHNLVALCRQEKNLPGSIDRFGGAQQKYCVYD
jgi:hypothetical protein